MISLFHCLPSFIFGRCSMQSTIIIIVIIIFFFIICCLVECFRAWVWVYKDAMLSDPFVGRKEIKGVMIFFCVYFFFASKTALCVHKSLATFSNNEMRQHHHTIQPSIFLVAWSFRHQKFQWCSDTIYSYNYQSLLKGIKILCYHINCKF